MPLVPVKTKTKTQRPPGPVYLKRADAIGLACPSSPRGCVAEGCAAWELAGEGWPNGAGRCTWHIKGTAFAELAMATALAHALTDPLTWESTPPDIMAASMPLRLAMDEADQAVAYALAGLRHQLTSFGDGTLDALLADITRRGVQIGAAGAAWGVGRSPTGGVGNTPPAKCSECRKPLKSQGADPGSALTAGDAQEEIRAGWTAALGSRSAVLGPLPVSSRVLRKRAIRLGDEVVRRDGTVVKVVQWLEPLGGRKRVTVQLPDADLFVDTLRLADGASGRPGPGDRAVARNGVKVEIVRRIESMYGRERVKVRHVGDPAWLDHLEHRKRRRVGLPTDRGVPVGSPRRKKAAARVCYVIGDQVEVHRTGGVVLRGEVREEMRPGVDGERQYHVRFEKTGKTWPVAAGHMRLVQKIGDGQ